MCDQLYANLSFTVCGVLYNCQNCIKIILRGLAINSFYCLKIHTFVGLPRAASCSELGEALSVM